MWRELGGRAVMLATLVACGEEPDKPSWQRLAQGFEPTSSSIERVPWRTTEGGSATWIGPGSSGHSRRIEVRLEQPQWTQRGERIWSAPRALASMPVESSGALPELRGKEQEFEYRPSEVCGQHFVGLDPTGWVDPSVEVAITRRIERPSFTLARGLVYLVLAPGTRPPEEAVLAEDLHLGRFENGAWRVEIGAIHADGVVVLPGFPESCSVVAAGASALSFDTVVLGGGAPGAPRPAATLRVLLGDAVVFEAEQAIRTEAHAQRHSVVLPAITGTHELRFEVEGSACRAAFLRPVLGPAARGVPGDRPWPQRPDVTLVVADTLRADSLAAWGGDARLTPTLNRFAANSHRFLGAQAVATWTLPSHASFLAARYPRELGVDSRGAKLPEQAVTIAERFAAQGYRTVAVTEAGFVTAGHGLDQGFEWFEEYRLPGGIHRSGPARAVAFERTLQRSLQEAAVDDGRPLFLFVHTYRTHDPYYVTQETRARLPDLALEGEADELLRELLDQGKPTGDGLPCVGPQGELALRIRDHYRGACADLDVGMETLFAGLNTRGRLPQGVLAFTSDHGEALGEHGVFGHGQGAWVEEAHVPLFVQAPGLPPGASSELVSLLSLPRTLAGLAGIGPDPSWLGRDLVRDPVSPEPLVIYQLGGRARTDVALHGPHWKLILDEGEGRKLGLLHAYRTTKDPQEQQDLRGAALAKSLRKRWAGLVFSRATPFLPAETAETTAEDRAALEALGYTGD